MDFGGQGGGETNCTFLVLREITGSNATVQGYHIAYELEASSLTSSIWDKTSGPLQRRISESMAVTQVRHIRAQSCLHLLISQPGWQGGGAPKEATCIFFQFRRHSLLHGINTEPNISGQRCVAEFLICPEWALIVKMFTTPSGFRVIIKFEKSLFRALLS